MKLVETFLHLILAVAKFRVNWPCNSSPTLFSRTRYKPVLRQGSACQYLIRCLALMLVCSASSGAPVFSDRMRIDAVSSSGNPLVATVTLVGLKTIEEGAQEDSLNFVTIALTGLRCRSVERFCPVSDIVFPDTRFDATKLDLSQAQLALVLRGVNGPGIALPGVILTEPAGETNDHAQTPSDFISATIIKAQEGNTDATGNGRLDFFSLVFNFASDTSLISPTPASGTSKRIAETGEDQDVTCQFFTACQRDAGGNLISSSVPFIVTVASDLGNSSLAVPEPGSLALVLLGLSIFMIGHRRRLLR